MRNQFIALAALLSLSGCSRHALSRDDAARLLMASGDFRKTSYLKVPATEEVAMDAGRCRTFQNREVWHAMVNVGWGTVQVRTTSSGGIFNIEYFECRLQLSPAGAAAAQGWRSWSDPVGASGWEIPVAATQLGAVTGVSQGEGAAVAQAEYAYRWVPTVAAQKLGVVPDGTLRTASATLQKFDDGWRLQSFSSAEAPDPQLSLVLPPAASPAADPPQPTARGATSGPATGAILGTWRAGSDLITFMPGGKYVDRALTGQFTGSYSFSAPKLVMKFPELEMTAEVLSLDGGTMKYRKVKVVGFDGNPEPADSKTYTMVRERGKKD